MKQTKSKCGRVIVAAAMIAAGEINSAVADVVRVYDVDDYVQDGIVLHFDGIRNAGAGLSHDSTRRTWKNLVDGQPDASIIGNGNGYWTNSLGFFFEGRDRNSYARLDSGITLGSNVTVQIAVDVDPSKQAGGEQAVSRNTMYFSSGVDTLCGIYTANTGSGAPKSSLRFIAGNDGGKEAIAAWGGKYATMIIDENRHGWLTETADCGTRYNVYVERMADNSYKYCWGGSPNTSVGRAVLGTYHAVRVYTNVLSDAQLAQNMRVDEARFRDAATAGKTPNVIVATDVAEADGVEPCGKYHVDGSHTFSARPVVADGVGFVCAGYTLETWNGSAWGAAVEHPGAAAYTHDTAQSAETVRITWLWTRQASVRTAADYDVDDYVQDGIVLHFDGIRNAGAGLSHDSTRRKWKNLVDGQPDASIIGDGKGYWTNSLGFFFEGRDRNSYAMLDDEINLGSNVTVQIAVDVDPSKQAGGEQGENRRTAYFSSDKGYLCGIYTFNTGSGDPKSSLSFIAGDDGGKEAIATWGGKYATMIIDENKHGWLTETADCGTGYNNVYVERMADNSYKYCWGGYTYSPKGGAVLGTYHAVRVYTNVLSDAQLAQNMRVDEIRFRNRGDVTVVNGGIAGTGTTGESSVPDGVYNVDSGEWTFTAETQTVGRVSCAPVLRVERWNGDGWALTSRERTGAYTYAAGGERVRLTWTWEPSSGMIVIIR